MVGEYKQQKRTYTTRMKLAVAGVIIGASAVLGTALYNCIRSRPKTGAPVPSLKRFKGKPIAVGGLALAVGSGLFGMPTKKQERSRN